MSEDEPSGYTKRLLEGTKPEVTQLKLFAYEERGVEAKPFIQGMLNRLTFGKERYEKDYPSMGRLAEDMADTAILSIKIALDHNIRERLIDAANYCFLAYRKMDDTGSLDDDSPGVVENGVVTRARGRFEHTNGKPLELVLDSMKDGLFNNGI